MTELRYHGMKVKNVVRFNPDGTVRINQWCVGEHQTITINVKPEDLIITETGAKK